MINIIHKKHDGPSNKVSLGECERERERQEVDDIA